MHNCMQWGKRGRNLPRPAAPSARYIPVASVLEGHVILKKNPDFVEDHLST